MNAAALPLIAGVEVRVAGQPLDDALAARLLEVRVDDHLSLPDVVSIRLGDPGLEQIDKHLLDIGAEVEILFGGTAANQLTSIFKGQITSLEPEFGASGAIIAVRGYDHGHALNRTRQSQTYQNMTAADIARKVARRAGLDIGTVDDRGGVHEHVQQLNETDWEFLWRLAAAVDFEVVVIDRRLSFRHAGGPTAGAPLALRWGDTLLNFRPRVTGVQQVDDVVVRAWDPKTKKAVESTGRPDPLSSEIGLARPGVVSALRGGTLTIADRPALSTEENEAVARSVASRLANAYVEAEGTCKGDPKLRAGSKVKIEGVGTRFGGTYTLTSTSHVFRSAKGYQTLFSVTGRSTRGLVDLTSRAARRDWASTVVIGVVTQNEDPDDIGRVRVRYPSLGDDAEGWWARIAAPGAGQERGLLMTPLVGDEVLVAFEHGDVRRPFVLGALYGGQAKPGADLVKPDGSFSLRSDEELSLVAKGAITMTSAKDLVVKTEGAVSTTATGDVTVEGQSVTVKSSGSLTVEASGSLTVKGSSITVEASGVCQVKGSQVMLG